MIKKYIAGYWQVFCQVNDGTFNMNSPGLRNLFCIKSSGKNDSSLNKPNAKIIIDLGKDHNNIYESK